MIGSITGKIKYKGIGYLILDVNGVGYKVFVIPTFLIPLNTGDEVSLFIHTYVREDQINLFGFETAEGLEFFEQLISVSGIGPKSALSILSLESLDMIKSAIVSEDPSVFTKVSGIGRKTAERVIIELREKVKTEKEHGPVAKEHTDAMDALVSLGYTQQQARDALRAVPATINDLQEKVKLALKALSK